MSHLRRRTEVATPSPTPRSWPGAGLPRKRGRGRTEFAA